MLFFVRVDFPQSNIQKKKRRNRKKRDARVVRGRSASARAWVPAVHRVCVCVSKHYPRDMTSKLNRLEKDAHGQWSSCYLMATQLKSYYSARPDCVPQALCTKVNFSAVSFSWRVMGIVVGRDGDDDDDGVSVTTKKNEEWPNQETIKKNRKPKAEVWLWQSIMQSMLGLPDEKWAYCIRWGRWE